MNDIAVNYARCFGTPAGRAVLAHLRSITTGRTLGPNASDSELRWAESQRALVRTIEALIARGRGNNT